MREKLQRFMAGRYGVDQLNRFYIGLTFVLLILSMVTRFSLLYLVALALLIYSYYRMFSKNVSKMYAQNQKFLNMRYRAVAKWNKTRNHMKQRKVYRFYKCPSCKQKVRVPKGKGRICITCPKCRTEFVKKS
ncbi:MAG: hypothetical protein MR355_10145 [Lachnospiraceae bacterium]|nr:hypothetical protein [Lachnospiraceae bacterium]